jgi:excisionase family DNA binding protein
MTANTEPKRLFTPAEQAAACRVTKPTLLEWYHQGIIPAEIAVGRVIRFDPDAVAAALKTNSNRRAAR